MQAAVEVGTRQVSLIFTARLNHSRAAGNRLIVSAVVSITPSLGWRLLRGSRRNDHERRKNHRTAQQSKTFASSHCPPRGSGPAIVAGRKAGRGLSDAVNVRLGSKADNGAGPRHVRFTPENGHSTYGPAHTMSSARLVSVAMAAASNERALHRNKPPAKSVGAADIQALIGYDRVGLGRCSGRSP